jgi:ubiquinol-cytochrome c reductase cytochrome b subunit
VRSAVYRPLYKIAFWLFAADCIFLGWLGSKPAEGIYIPLMQVSTLIYFAFFLVVMPLLGYIERPRRTPNSITEAVLAKKGGGAAAQPYVAASPETKVERV